MLLNPLLTLLGLLALLLYPYVFVTWKTYRRVIECERFETANPEEMPEDIREAIQPYICELEMLQFKVVKHQLIYTGEVGKPPAWGLTFQDPHSLNYLCLGALQPFHEMGRTIVIEFVTFLDDQKVLFTTKAKNYGLFKPFPREIKQNLINCSISELWQAHQAKLEAIPGQPVHLSPEEFIENLSAYASESIEFSVEHKRLVWIERGKTYHYTIGTAIKLMSKVMVEFIFSKKKSQPQSDLARSSQLEQEIKSFLASQKPKPPMAKRTRGWLALASLAVFIAVYATRFDPKTLLFFIAALILHEGGHLLAMIICGYREPIVFFIPFLGALATARKEHATLTEKFWISLAGPLPGLILGITIAIVSTWGQNSIEALLNWNSVTNPWHGASLILIGLNLFNLLPIYPLDGGQISDLLIFARNPYLGVIYKSIGVLLLMLLGLGSPLMFVFAFLIALSIPHSFQIARHFSGLRRELKNIPLDDNESSARLIFSQLQSAPKLSFAQKNVIASGIFESRRSDSAPWSSRIGLSIIYLISLIGGVIGGIYAIFPDIKAIVAIPENTIQTIRVMTQGTEGMMRDRLEIETKAIQRNPQDWLAYTRRGSARLVLNDTTGAIADANTVLSNDPNSIPAYQLRSRAYAKSGDVQKSKADQQQALKLRWMPEFQKAHAAIQKNPKDVEAYFKRGDAKRNLGDESGAFQDYDKALKLDPNHVQGLIRRAFLFESQQNHQAALKDINQAIGLDTKNVEAYETRAELYTKLGEPEKAAADDAKVQELMQQSMQKQQ